MTINNDKWKNNKKTMKEKVRKYFLVGKKTKTESKKTELILEVVDLNVFLIEKAGINMPKTYFPNICKCISHKIEKILWWYLGQQCWQQPIHTIYFYHYTVLNKVNKKTRNVTKKNKTI